jgi:hypothetical protein
MAYGIDLSTNEIASQATRVWSIIVRREMESYQDLKTKWRRRLGDGTASYNFGLDELAPGKFCVLYSDFGGSMACHSSIEVVGVFEDAKDFLGFVRHAELPRILDYASGTLREPFPGIADSYLLKYEGDERERIDHLIGKIDIALRGETIFDSALSIICDQFNKSFEGTNPSVQILAWGSLADVLASDHFEEAFEDAIEEETDEDGKPITALKALLDAGEFDENNEEHLVLTKGFLDRSMGFLTSIA